MSEVLVSALLARLDELEKAAQAATQKPWGVREYDDSYSMSAIAVTTNDADEDPGPEDVVAVTLLQTPHAAVVYDGMWRENAVHIAANGPLAVLRLCRAHRDLIARHKPAPWTYYDVANDTEEERLYCETCAVGASCSCCLSCEDRKWPCDELKILARGLGVEEPTP